MQVDKSKRRGVELSAIRRLRTAFFWGGDFPLPKACFFFIAFAQQKAMKTRGVRGDFPEDFSS
jgi:hypothetical protein